MFGEDFWIQHDHHLVHAALQDMAKECFEYAGAAGLQTRAFFAHFRVRNRARGTRDELRDQRLGQCLQLRSAELERKYSMS